MLCGGIARAGGSEPRGGQHLADSTAVHYHCLLFLFTEPIETRHGEIQTTAPPFTLLISSRVIQPGSQSNFPTAVHYVMLYYMMLCHSIVHYTDTIPYSNML